MPPKREDVDWAVIRREWETTDVSDLVLSQRWGFKSANTIQRRRTHEGWSRNVDAITADLVTKAMAKVGNVGAGTAGGGEAGRWRAHTHTHDAHTGTEQKQRPDPSAEPPVCAKSASRAPHTHTQEPAAHTHAGSQQQQARDLVEAEKLTTARDLADILASAKAAQLARGRRMCEVGQAWLEHLMTLATAPRGDEENDHPYEVARIRVASVNPDKDTITSLMKAATAMIAEGVKIERAALGMDQPAAAAGPGAGGPGVAVRVEDVTRLLGLGGLERLALAAKQATQLRPTMTIDGKAEPNPKGEPP